MAKISREKKDKNENFNIIVLVFVKLLISPELAVIKIQYCFCVLAENGVKKMHYNEKHKIFKQQTLDWKQAVVSVSRLPWVYWGCV